jgi:hypothetical protein
MAGLVAGIAVTVFGGDVLDGLRGEQRQAPVAALVADATEGETFEPAPVVSDRDLPAGAPAPTPGAAVERFLEAEVARDHERSFALLVAEQRQSYATPANWRAAHGSIFPVVGFDIVDDAAPTGRVVVDVRYRPGLDEVIGLVPGRARTAWTVRREGGGWLVDVGAVDIEPSYPSQRDVRGVVRRWVDARQACRPAAEYAGGLVGRASLADGLCRTPGSLAIGPVTALAPADSAAFVSAFGPPAASWARAVQLAGPVELTVVLAPVGDEWLVVGVV